MISKCRADSVAFDGIEELFWPVYNNSPGVKIIALTWRTYKERSRSALSFGPQLQFSLLLLGFGLGGAHQLPWAAVWLALDPVAEWFLGRPVIKGRLKEGGPVNFMQYDFWWALWHANTNVQ